MAVTVARRWLGRVAAGAAVPVFAAVGGGARDTVERLRLHPRVDLVDSPRHATILLVAGHIPPALAGPLAQVHDALPHPRATVRWTASPSESADGLKSADAVTVPEDGDIVAALTNVHRDVCTGARRSDPPILPDEDPVVWRGVGPYGHGGSGMTGGRPFGRPLAERADDLRDGLTLDVLPIRVGPFFPAFPPGLSMRAVLQGDVVQDLQVGPNPFAGAAASTSLRPPDPFDRARREPVLVADVETARARHHLRWLARGLRLHGLDTLGVRALSLAEHPQPPTPASVERLARALRVTGILSAATRELGVLDGARVTGRGLGWIARAAGVAEDPRAQDRAYAAAGFDTVTTAGGDASARWRQRLAELRQSVILARTAGGLMTGAGAAVEGPSGPLETGGAGQRYLLGALPDLVRGAEWGDAVTILASLDVDLTQAARDRGAA